MDFPCPTSEHSWPALADWLTTLELITKYDKYFTLAELAELEQNKTEAKDDLEQRWPQMVAKVRQLMTDGVPAEDPGAQALAREWMEMTQKLIGGNGNLLVKLDTMTRQEESIQQQSGIDPANARMTAIHCHGELYRVRHGLPHVSIPKLSLA